MVTSVSSTPVVEDLTFGGTLTSGRRHPSGAGMPHSCHNNCTQRLSSFLDSASLSLKNIETIVPSMLYISKICSSTKFGDQEHLGNKLQHSSEVSFS